MQDFYWLHKERATSLAHITSDKPLLYNLFGSLDEPDSLVITENNLLDFLFRQASWQAFADDLSQRFHDVTPRRGVTLEAQPVSEDAPTVFLCHCSADAEAVAEVSARLQELGVRTWVDRQNLRDGDRWHQILGKAIQEWVHYFVVLETPAMLTRPESYYYLEIDAALECARRFRPGTKFIFPAQLEPCARLEQLAHLQRIDLTTPNGLEQLATEILHDWARRRGSHQP